MNCSECSANDTCFDIVSCNEKHKIMSVHDAKIREEERKRLKPIIQEIHDSVYEQGKADGIESIKAEIKDMKNQSKLIKNNDYLIGYMSVLSTLEGFCEIAKEQK